jgi:hypothetical protein
MSISTRGFRVTSLHRTMIVTLPIMFASGAYDGGKSSSLLSGRAICADNAAEREHILSGCIISLSEVTGGAEISG